MMAALVQHMKYESTVVILNISVDRNKNDFQEFGNFQLRT